MSKPFSPRELMMRIAAIRKRTSSAAGPVQPDVFLHGGLCVDFTARKLTVDGKPIDGCVIPADAAPCRHRVEAVIR